MLPAVVVGLAHHHEVGVDVGDGETGLVELVGRPFTRSHRPFAILALEKIGGPHGGGGWPPSGTPDAERSGFADLFWVWAGSWRKSNCCPAPAGGGRSDRHRTRSLLCRMTPSMSQMTFFFMNTCRAQARGAKAPTFNVFNRLWFCVAIIRVL